MKQKKIKQSPPANKGKRRRPVEVRWDPDSEELLREQLKSPEGQRLMRELIRVLAEAAVERMLRETPTEPSDATPELR